MEKDFKLFRISAFIDETLSFQGNEAAVCLLDKWPDDSILQLVAAKIGLPETAFLSRQQKLCNYRLRWFTPEIEMDLCGHATLASAHFLFDRHAELSKIEFNTIAGALTARKKHGIIILDFPARPPKPHPLPEVILAGIGKKPVEVLKARDYLLIYGSEEDIENIKPDKHILDQINLDPGGIVVSAKGRTADFVSRYFTPQASIFEDPVTGSAHCSLIPYWSYKLGKKNLVAHQLSTSGGKLFCRDQAERVSIGGQCVTLKEISVSV